MDFTIFVYGNLKPSRKCVYNRCPYSMKSSWNFISTFIKLSSSMEHSIYGFKCRLSGFRMNIYRDSTTIIMNRYRTIFIENSTNIFTVSSECLIYCIVYNFLNHMMKSSTISTPNIHTRSLSYRFKSLENSNLRGVIFMSGFRCSHRVFYSQLIKKCFSL